MEGWISEKLQVALDEAYRDPTNLQSKLQKQAAFEAELQVFYINQIDDDN